MKAFRWAAALVLALFSLMNLGAVGGDTPIGLSIAGAVLGMAGLVAVYGLFRDRAWGIRLAAAVGAVNLILAAIGLAAGWGGSAIGLTISAVGLALLAPVLIRRRPVVAAH